MPVLTGIDLLGIQDYIFASNRLRDVLAASWMVEYVLADGKGMHRMRFSSQQAAMLSLNFSHSMRPRYGLHYTLDGSWMKRRGWRLLSLMYRLSTVSSRKRLANCRPPWPRPS